MYVCLTAIIIFAIIILIFMIVFMCVSGGYKVMAVSGWYEAWQFRLTAVLCGVRSCTGISWYPLPLSTPCSSLGTNVSTP